MCRRAINLKHLCLTDFKVKVAPSARSGPVKKAFQKANVLENWEKTSWAKKLSARKKRATLSDFDRFKLKCLKQKVKLVLVQIFMNHVLTGGFLKRLAYMTNKITLSWVEKKITRIDSP